jgi:antitoxin FitA
MAQLLVRNVEDFVVSNLRRRAAMHGVSAEEEHRRTLREVLLQPAPNRPSLMDFLLADGGAAPEVELEIDRPTGGDVHRDLSG